MNIKIIIVSLIVFIMSLLLHVLVWRLKKPVNDLAALFFFLFLIPTTGMISAAAINIAPLDFGSELCASILLENALAAAYVLTYPAFQADSPSLRIILFLSNARSGMTAEDIKIELTRRNLFDARLDDLQKSGLARQNTGKFSLTYWGTALAFSFSAYRKILGFRDKGG